MTFQQWKNYKKHYIHLNTTFEMPLFLLQEFDEQTTAFDCYKYGLFLHDQQMINRLFFKLLLSKYVLKILATCLASSKAG